LKVSGVSDTLGALKVLILPYHLYESLQGNLLGEYTRAGSKGAFDTNLNNI